MTVAYSSGVKSRPARSAPIHVCAFRVVKHIGYLTFYPYLEFDEFKKSLGDEAEGVTDAQIEELRTFGYKFADAVFEQWLRKRNARIPPKTPQI